MKAMKITRPLHFRLLRSSCFLLSFCLMLGFTGISCDDDDDKAPSNVLNYKDLSLTGAKEVPANSSTYTGTLNGTYNKDTNMLTYNITWSGFTATNMHFHKGGPTESGPPVLAIPAPFTSPKSGTFTLTEDQETDLVNGLFYINIHSQQHPAGEIRAQMIAN